MSGNHATLDRAPWQQGRGGPRVSATGTAAKPRAAAVPSRYRFTTSILSRTAAVSTRWPTFKRSADDAT